MKIFKSIMLISICLIANNAVCMDEKAYKERIIELYTQATNLSTEIRHLQIQGVDAKAEEKLKQLEKLKDEISKLELENLLKKFIQKNQKFPEVATQLSILIRNQKPEDNELIQKLTKELEQLKDEIANLGDQVDELLKQSKTEKKSA